jgi:hypothetical protein
MAFTIEPLSALNRATSGYRSDTANNLWTHKDDPAARGQSAIMVALLVGFLVIPLGIGLFEWRMQQITYTALQTALREAARDGTGEFAAGTLAAGAPQLDPQQVATAVQQSLATNLLGTLPEVSASDADIAARQASTQGLTITGLTVCVAVAVPVHFITQPARTWIYSAQACAHSIVPGGGP